MDESNSKCAKIKQEFQLEKFGLKNDRPKVFVTSKCGSHVFYLVWTMMWALYHVTILALDVYYTTVHHNREPWPVYLTHIGYSLLTIYAVCDCIAAFYVTFKRLDIILHETSVTPWYLKAVWVLYNTSNTTAIFVTLAYYSLLQIKFSFFSVAMHMVNAIYIILNMCVGAKPTQILHFYHTMVFAILYTLVTLIHHFSGGDPIYPAVDWTKISTLPIMLGVVFIASPIAHVFIYTIYRLKAWLSNSCRNNTALEQDTKELRQEYYKYI